MAVQEVEGALEGMGLGWPEFLWAVQVLHSRCFFDGAMGLHLCGQHLLVRLQVEMPLCAALVRIALVPRLNRNPLHARREPVEGPPN